MEIIKKHGLIITKENDRVYINNILTYPGESIENFLPGTGGIYSLFYDGKYFDGTGLGVNSITETKDNIEVIFINDEIKLRISFTYDVPSGVWSRKDYITNMKEESIFLNKYKSRFVLADSDQNFEVYTQNSGWCSENQGSWQDIGRGLRVETRSLRVMDGATPYMAIRRKNLGKGLTFHLSPIGKWSIDIIKRIAYSKKASYVIDTGLSETGLNMEIFPHETVEMPETIFHSFDDISLGSHKLHRFVLENRFNANEPKVIYNSWLYNFDNFTLEDLKRQVIAAKDIGCECFLVDAGWYGEESWDRATGDWKESSVKFPDGLKEFGDFVKSQGLGLGLWMECERASKHSEIYKKHPEYFFETEDDINSVIVDFGNPDARAHVKSEISRLIDTYDLKMMKFDFNVGCTHDKTGSNFYRYYQNFYKMMEELKEQYPYFFFEGCAGGGCCSDLSSTAKYDCHHMTDTVHPLLDLRIYQGAVLRLPPYSLSKWVCIQNTDLKSKNVTYQTENRVISNSNQFLYERMADCGLEFTSEQASLGILGFSSDIDALCNVTRKTLKEYVADFKQERRERSKYICSLLTEPVSISDFSSPAIFEISDFDYNKIIIKGFRTEGAEENFIVNPLGIDKNATYEICENDEKKIVKGEEILEFGLSVFIDYVYKVKTIVINKVQ